MKQCKSSFNKMTMPTFRDTVLLRGVGSNGVVTDAMK